MDNVDRRRGPACSHLRFVAHEAEALCKCIFGTLGLGTLGLGSLGLGDERVRHLVLVDTAAYASREAMEAVGARPRSGVRLAFVTSVWDVSRAVAGLRDLQSVSVVVGAESSKRAVLRCGKAEGRFVYAALVEAARMVGLDTVHVLGIDAGAIAAFLDFKRDDDADTAVTILASGADWKVMWSSTGQRPTRAQARHADMLFGR